MDAHNITSHLLYTQKALPSKALKKRLFSSSSSVYYTTLLKSKKLILINNRCIPTFDINLYLICPCHLQRYYIKRHRFLKDCQTSLVMYQLNFRIKQWRINRSVTWYSK